MSGKYPFFLKVFDAYAMVARTCSFLYSKIDCPRCAMSQSPSYLTMKEQNKGKPELDLGEFFWKSVKKGAVR
jgi:hypothetical protein